MRIFTDLVKDLLKALKISAKITKEMENSTEGDIIWIENSTFPIQCKICGDSSAKDLILKVKNPFQTENFLDLYKCKNCHTCFFYPFNYPDYKNPIFDKYIKFYVEQGAGIDFMIMYLVKLEKDFKDKSFCDVGYGFGFSVHFAQNFLKMKAVGIEPGLEGKVGSKLLNIKIYNDYLENVKEISGEKFDIILSSEVIEHVKDPLGFLFNLKEFANKETVVIITTLNSNWIKKDTKYSTLLEILFPAFHHYICSPYALDILAKKAGFRVRKIIEHTHRLILYASNKEFEIMTFEEVDFRKKIYIPYLYQIVNERKTSDILYDGASWRLFKELVNMGEYEKALEIYEKTNLKNFLESESFENLINNIENIKTFDEFGSKYPYFLPGALYYLGMLLLNHIADYECSAKSFKSSFIVGLKCLSLGTAYYEEMADLLWWAKFHEGLSYLYRGNISEAIKCFGLILENFNNPNKRFFFITPSKLIVKRVIKSLEQWLGE